MSPGGRARILRDRRGATVVEFAFVLPVMLVLMMGMMELGYQAYVQSVITGAVQKAGRDSGIQGATPASIDARVLAQVQAVAPGATFAAGYPTRSSYTSFSAVAPEPFVDTNGNGVRDPGECYTDVNGNGQWDADAGRAGQGGPNDVTVYTAAITYGRLFPVARLLGWPGTATLSATTTLMNQPYATQNVPTPATICT
ncbi:MAG: pilus assembly protein [Sphingomonas sp.]|uniref:TadE/TadG family type IV pilus assembly protein n=1 Tax=unclassified Sphingomonas TaxID=196159 RepID=UPI0024582B59|nr:MULTISPECIES: TadE/TadG family type IV pilus assembly protein [unclassified Sphingomonas]MBQ1498751.1 pilus assembly protein [Sphingomonas sp.]MDH4745964.1 pilus assembly protein [Sphingomonas sp. CBMAI 2297]